MGEISLHSIAIMLFIIAYFHEEDVKCVDISGFYSGVVTFILINGSFVRLPLLFSVSVRLYFPEAY